jgi:hypothetical protein
VSGTAPKAAHANDGWLIGHDNSLEMSGLTKNDVAHLGTNPRTDTAQLFEPAASEPFTDTKTCASISRSALTSEALAGSMKGPKKSWYWNAGRLKNDPLIEAICFFDPAVRQRDAVPNPGVIN